MDKSEYSTPAWRALAQYLPRLKPDSEHWWQLTGPHIAALVEGAGYSTEKQYEALLFHYHWMVPYMGPAPWAEGISLKWKSLLQPDGTPIEYSWKWNTKYTVPDVRYDIEPIGEYAGTPLDPLNQQAGREMLARLAESIPTVDLQWSDHFFSTFYDHNMAKYAEEAAAGSKPTSSVVIAAEFLEKGLRFKTYFQPRKLGQPGIMPVAQYEETLVQIDAESRARAALHDFLATSEEGKVLAPFSVAVDNVKPEKSRLKWYFNSPHTSFAAVREVMSLGGRVDTPHFQRQIADLHRLFKTVLQLPDDYPEDKEIPTATANKRAFDDGSEAAPAVLPGFVYYFDIAPGNALPNVKFALPLLNHGRDDLALAQSITGWMQSRGLGAYCDAYVAALQKMAGSQPLSETVGLQSFISCLFLANGELDFTTYFAPAALNADKSQPAASSSSS